ncbi:MAG: FtsX-like permease family protein [Cyclobacteriaceae bacterium]
MISSYFLLAIRTFLRNKIPFIINLLGMSIALGCCITAYINYQHSAGYDEQQENASNLYRIGFWQKNEEGQTPYGVCPMPVGNLIRESLGEGEKVIQYISKGGQFRIGDEMFQRQFVYADPDFTEVFSINLISGSLSLQNKNHILISDKLAKTYYGNENALGKPLTQIISGEPREFEVGGVYEAFPSNSSFRFDLLTTFDNYFIDVGEQSLVENDWSKWATTFLYLKDNATIASLTKQLEQYIAPQNDARKDLQANAYYIEPFIGMSSRALKERNQGHWLNMPMPTAAVIAPFTMAAFLLLVACFNYMNNSIAIAGSRLKEIGIRKVIGGRRKELIVQFLSETMIFCFVSLLLALLLAEYFTEGWNYMWNGLDLNIVYKDNMSMFLVLALLLLFTSLIAGGYSAFYISSFKPIHVLRGNTTMRGGNMLTKSLLVFQFSISLAAVIFALAFYHNAKFQKAYDLGYSYQSVIQVPLDNPQQFELLRNELSGSRLIQNVGGTEDHIYNNSYKAAARYGNMDDTEVDMLNVGDGYFKTLNVRLIKGRSFEKESQSDIEESIVVNEEFVRVLGLGEDALDKRITLNDTTHVYIKGIVKDVYMRALFQPLTPLVFRYVPVDNYKYLVASTSPEQLVETNVEIKAAWQQLFPNMLYTGKLMEERMVMVREHFDSVVILYTFLGLVAIVMSISGLYSLVSLNLQKRSKEFGIRKIIGASLPHMTYQASKLFITTMLISFVIGSLLGSVMVNGLMSSVWEYYEAINSTVIGLAITILSVIAISTIGYKIFKVTVANPVEFLRQD